MAPQFGPRVPQFVACRKCGMMIKNSHMDRHVNSKPCQLEMTLVKRRVSGWMACSTQILGILDDFGLGYEFEYYKLFSEVNGAVIGLPAVWSTAGYYKPIRMPYVFVRGTVGLLCQCLKAKPLRWALDRILTDEEFYDAMKSAELIDGPYAVAIFVERQWQNRKGSHKNKKVSGLRKKYQDLPRDFSYE